jgi:hypothetical protein
MPFRQAALSSLSLTFNSELFPGWSFAGANLSCRAKQTAGQFSSQQLSQWLESIPNGSQIIPQLQKVKEVAENRGQEAEGIVKDIVGEIKQVLDRKKADVEKLYEEGKQDLQR